MGKIIYIPKYKCPSCGTLKSGDRAKMCDKHQREIDEYWLENFNPETLNED